ncbi:hypothetical protein IQ268_15590 [Oculatella sp. LEGE 06141]|uniref:hypothetical protein n=1 Tax=Oculatella sp. LEGE 06141 TaxID=1828648 RepID=UPI00187FE54A|nr:hypothetical protein [Oculatella sp. LEGE 06141]MBE9179992.1 hypothetical protein [Oculatella sp. LEGE 06141]
MTHASNLNDFVSESAAPYRDRLHHWAIARLFPNMEWQIVARFRRRSDADGHLQFLRQHHPQTEFVVMFDHQ